MKIVASLMIAGVLAFSCAQTGYAQAPTPQVPTQAPAAAMKMGGVSDETKKAKAKACSTQADAKGLHGKPRKEFRSKCKQS
jgi:hypothetical protein